MIHMVLALWAQEMITLCVDVRRLEHWCREDEVALGAAAIRGTSVKSPLKGGKGNLLEELHRMA